jgi:hypothetical protein
MVFLSTLPVRRVALKGGRAGRLGLRVPQSGSSGEGRCKRSDSGRDASTAVGGLAVEGVGWVNWSGLATVIAETSQVLPAPLHRFLGSESTWHINRLRPVRPRLIAPAVSG